MGVEEPGLNLGNEIIEVLRTLVKLQERYIELVNSEDDAATGSLQDYRMLCTKMMEWGEQLDNNTKGSLFGNRVIGKLVSVRSASLLLPALDILLCLLNFSVERRRVGSGSEDDILPVHLYSGRVLYKLGEKLSSTLTWCVQSLQGSQETRIYSNQEAESIFSKAGSILETLCNLDTNLTRHIISYQDDIKESLQIFMRRFDSQNFRDLYEAIESEEECIREEEAKLSATITIQATVKMWRQRRLWKKLRNGMIACQRLFRQRRKRKEKDRGFSLEEEKFRQQLKDISERKHCLEIKYRRLERVNPSRYGSYLESERIVAALKIQNWWRRMKRSPLDSAREMEEERRDRAVRIIQAATRRWLVGRRNAPVWSQLLAPRVISEERSRQLQQDIDTWQQRNKINVNTEELDILHKQSQDQYREFVANRGVRRLSEHRENLIRAQLTANAHLLRSSPKLDEYRPDMWSSFHTLPLPLATAARLKHQKQLEKLGWPLWKRKIDDILKI